MKEQELKNFKVAILTENGFEQVELTSPKEALEQQGVTVHIVSPQKKEVRAWDGDKKNWGITLPVDKHVSEVKVTDYDALVLPGGVINPDQLRTNEEAVNFVRAFFDTGKPLAAICHGPQTLIEAGVVSGRHVTSYMSIRTDLINAGAIWLNNEVVVDEGLITSRSPDDLPAFNQKVLEELKEGVHEGRFV